MERGTVYFTEIPECRNGRAAEHLTGERLLGEAVRRSFDLDLSEEIRDTGPHGKPFFPLHPEIHYNISHSGRYVYCVLAPCEVGVDIQEHRNIALERMLKRTVPEELREEILGSAHAEKLFFDQWALREAYCKMTGSGLAADLTLLPLEQAWHWLFQPEEGYSGAICCSVPLELEWHSVDVRDRSEYE